MISLKCNDREGLDLVVNLFLRTGFHVVLDDNQPDKALCKRAGVQVLIELAPPRQSFTLVGPPVCYRLLPPSIAEDVGALGGAYLAAPRPTSTPPPDPLPVNGEGGRIAVQGVMERRQSIPVNVVPMCYAVRVIEMWAQGQVETRELGCDEAAARRALRRVIDDLDGVVVPLMTLQDKFVVTTPRGVVQIEWLEQVKGD